MMLLRFSTIHNDFNLVLLRPALQYISINRALFVIISFDYDTACIFKNNMNREKVQSCRAFWFIHRDRRIKFKE